MPEPPKNDKSGDDNEFEGLTKEGSKSQGSTPLNHGRRKDSSETNTSHKIAEGIMGDSNHGVIVE